MVGHDIPSRQPAVRVGGQRRRLSRPPPRAAVTRSRTLPVLTGGSESGDFYAESQSPENVAATHGQEGATVETSQSMANFHSSTGILPDLRPRDNSPTPTSGSASSAVTRGRKKKHGLTLNNPFRKQAPLPQTTVPQTPLPPATPTKAAKLLGLDPESPVLIKANGGALDGVEEDRPGVKFGWSQQHSTPLLTDPNNGRPGRLYDHIDADDEDEPQKSRGFWKTSKQTAMKFVSPTNHSGTRLLSHSNRHSLPALDPFSRADDLETNFVHRLHTVDTGRHLQYGSNSHPHSGSEDIVHRQRLHPRTVDRHMAQKEMIDRMTPITEASHDDMGAAYLDGEDNSELDVIDEYTDRQRPYSNLVIPQRVESLNPLPSYGSYQLDPEDMSPVDDGAEQEIQFAEEQEEHSVLPNTVAEVKKLQHVVVRRRSPLQAVEDHFLNVAEKELEAKKDVKIREAAAPKRDHRSIQDEPVEPVESSKVKELPAVLDLDLTAYELEAEKHRVACDVHDATRMALDQDVAAMFERHLQFKKDFEPYAIKGSKVGEADEIVSLRSSIDLDEEPTLHVATAMTITRVKPGMVKVVDIPPRKKKEKKKDE